MRADVRGMRKILVTATILIIVAAVVAYAGISVYAANVFTLNERYLPDPEHAALVGSPYEAVSFRTSDGLLMRGWYFPRGARAVVFVHGKESVRLNDQQTIDRAKVLLANGYSVLAFDLRGGGESEGDRFSLGEYERLDVAAAIAYLEGRGYGAKDIALMGHSMGAATTLQALALRPDVGPVIVDSAFTDAERVVNEGFTHDSGLPSFFVPGVLLAARLFGLDHTTIRPIDQVRAHPERAFFFIHCENDDFIPVHHARDLAAASANAETQLWIVPGCGHTEAYVTAPAEYDARMLAFLRQQFR